MLPDFVEYISGEKEIFATRIYSVFSPDRQVWERAGQEWGSWLMLLDLRRQERPPKSQYAPLGRYSRR
ncbi:hypothetical protein [Paenibacillus ottowii]